jgi:hypothetical protein
MYFTDQSGVIRVDTSGSGASPFAFSLIAFAQPDAAPELDLVHCFFKLSAWRDYGGPSHEHAHRTRPHILSGGGGSES